jgi:hypothetical protein
MIRGEPGLKELLSDSIVRLLALSDGLSLEELEAAWESARARIVVASGCQPNSLASQAAVGKIRS